MITWLISPFLHPPIPLLFNFTASTANTEGTRPPRLIKRTVSKMCYWTQGYYRCGHYDEPARHSEVCPFDKPQPSCEEEQDSPLIQQINTECGNCEPVSPPSSAAPRIPSHPEGNIHPALRSVQQPMLPDQLTPFRAIARTHTLRNKRSSSDADLRQPAVDESGAIGQSAAHERRLASYVRPSSKRQRVANVPVLSSNVTELEFIPEVSHYRDSSSDHAYDTDKVDLASAQHGVWDPFTAGASFHPTPSMRRRNRYSPTEDGPSQLKRRSPGYPPKPRRVSPKQVNFAAVPVQQQAYRAYTPYYGHESYQHMHDFVERKILEDVYSETYICSLKEFKALKTSDQQALLGDYYSMLDRRQAAQTDTRGFRQGIPGRRVKKMKESESSGLFGRMTNKLFGRK